VHARINIHPRAHTPTGLELEPVRDTSEADAVRDTFVELEPVRVTLEVDAVRDTFAAPVLCVCACRVGLIHD